MAHEFDLDPIYVKPDSNGNLYSSSMGTINTSDPLMAIQQAAEKNNLWSAEQAAKQNEFQVAQNQKAMQFSAEQAALNRSWQEEMSNTAHQREVLDLQRAGLNPVLSATGGNGASVGSGVTASGVTSAGAKADTDESLTMALMSYMAQQMQAQTAIMNTQTSANATLANAELMSSASRYAADLNYALGMNEPGHAAVGYVKDMLDPYGEGLGSKSMNAAADLSGKVKSWLGSMYDKFTGDNQRADSKVGKGTSVSKSNNGSHSSGKFYEENGQVEKAVANARAVIDHAYESSGLKLFGLINDKTNGALAEKAKRASKK